MAEATQIIPSCIGIIMDGNRRFAKERGIPQLEGHRQGDEKIKETLEWAKEGGIRNIIFYAFSTENWNRPKEEVIYLMDLLRYVLTKEVSILKKRGVRIRCVGD